MPRSLDWEKYPEQFLRTFELALLEGEVEVEHPHPASFRATFQAFIKALERGHPNESLRRDAKDIMVKLSPEKRVVILRRSESRDARILDAVLASRGAGIPAVVPSAALLALAQPAASPQSPAGLSGLSPWMTVPTPETGGKS